VTPAEIQELQSYLTPEEQAELDALVAADIEDRPFSPLVGPQTMAYNSTADVVGFGGAAGGGKSFLAAGKALTQFDKSMILRRNGTELTAIIDEVLSMAGTRDGYNGQDKILRLDDRQIEFGSTPNAGDEKKYQGRPHSFLCFDEAANFQELQVRFLMGWNRSTTPGQRCQTLLTFNPPTSAEGRWIVAFFAPWLDKRFPGKRASPGEIRHVGVVPGANGVSRDIWVDGPEQFVIVAGQPVYDFNPADYQPQDIVRPQTRTFIPSRISDNPYLMGSGYLAVLQAMPEPLRSQMLYGDFEAGMTDDPWQVIPTAWVEAAMMRWTPQSPKGEMSSMGVDVARGGKDFTTIAMRHGNWYDHLVKLPGKDTPSGQHVVGQIFAVRRDSAPIHIDVIGVGASPFDLLKDANAQVIGVNVAERSLMTDRSGRMTFANQRSELWWRLRESLDPENDSGVALPPDPELLADLCAPQWKLLGMKVQVESRDDIIKRIGRSPDKASAVILAQLDTPNYAKVKRKADTVRQDVLNYDPLADF
jgi:hypothetical protein